MSSYLAYVLRGIARDMEVASSRLKAIDEGGKEISELKEKIRELVILIGSITETQDRRSQ